MSGLALGRFHGVGAQSTASLSITSTGTITPVNSRLEGLNYNTVHMEWVSDDMLRRDFALFQHDGVNIISLSLYWFQLEGDNRGDYNGSHANGVPYGDLFLDNVKRFIEIADQYSIKVLVTFHTLWDLTGDEWCTPAYVTDEQGYNTQLAIVEDENMKQAFLDMVNHTVTYLKDEKVYAWALLNEPWGSGCENIFINLIQRESALVKSIVNEPVTVRFVNDNTWMNPDGSIGIMNHFSTYWNWNQSIFDSLDFISLNAYLPDKQTYNSYANITTENVNGIIQRGKTVLITEFGYPSDNDSIQADFYNTTLNLLDKLPVMGWMAWNWNQYDSNDVGKGWNLLKDQNGNPRTAYIEMLNHQPQV